MYRDQPRRGEPLALFLSRSEHAYTRAELTGWFSRHAWDRALADRTAVRLRPGIMAGVAHRDRPLVRAEALTLWKPWSWVSGELALSVFSDRMPQPHYDDIVVPHGQHLLPAPHLRVRQVGPLSESSWRHGVRCTTPAFATLDAWHRSTRSRRLDVLYGALWQRVSSPADLFPVLDSLPRIADRTKLIDCLHWFARGATSPLEVLAHSTVFVGRQFEAFELQAELQVGGRRAVADMLHRAARVVVEFDGSAYHDLPQVRARDRRRDADLASAGFLTLRFGWSDLRERPEWCRERVSAVVRQRLCAAVSG